MFFDQNSEFKYHQLDDDKAIVNYTSFIFEVCVLYGLITYLAISETLKKQRKEEK